MSNQKSETLETLIQQSELRYIAIEGVIGAGKTTLAKKLGDVIGAKVVIEQFEENPFLKDFYKDPERYAFQTQIFFLLSRYKQQQQLSQADLFHRFLVTDYIFEKDKIFAYLNLQDEELKLYETLIAAFSTTSPRLISSCISSRACRGLMLISNTGLGILKSTCRKATSLI